MSIRIASASLSFGVLHNQQVSLLLLYPHSVKKSLEFTVMGAFEMLAGGVLGAANFGAAFGIECAL